MQNLFVIFPPGAGGNHLSNLVALSNQYDRCVDYTKYDSISGPAHFANHQNLAPCQTFFQDIQNQNNVLCCHLAQYLWCQANDRFEKQKVHDHASPIRLQSAPNHHDEIRIGSRNRNLSTIYLHRPRRVDIIVHRTYHNVPLIGRDASS